jgi:hypothetical protein
MLYRTAPIVMITEVCNRHSLLYVHPPGNHTIQSITLVNKSCTVSKHNHSLANVFLYFSVLCLLATDVLDDNATRKSVNN